MLITTAIAPAVSVALDLFPTHLEVTQSIQDQGAAVPLIERRQTWVRVYVDTDGASAFATARLFGERGGPGGTLLGAVYPANPLGGRALLALAPNRADTSSSFQFQVPASWLTGTVHFRAVIDSAGEVVETNENNNTIERTVEFDSPLHMRISLIDILHPGSSAPRAVDKLFALSFLFRSFPATRIDFRGSRSWPVIFNLGNAVCTCPLDASGNCTREGTCANGAALRCSTDAECGCSFVNSRMSRLRRNDYLFWSGFHDIDRRYYGLVDDGGGTAFMRGCSPIGGSTGSGPAGDPANFVRFNWDTDASYADWYTAHELGHAYGRRHAPCCDAEGSSAHFPDPNCSMSSTGDETYYGFDSLDRTALAPSANQGDDGKHTDIMSYCPQQWPSDYTYEGIYQRAYLDSTILSSLPGQPVEYVVVSATANLDLDTAILGPMHRIVSDRVPLETIDGDWSFRFEDAEQGTLLEHKFAPLPVELGHPGDPSLLGVARHQSALISEIIPYVAGTARVALTHLGNELDAFVVSPNPPSVTLLGPNGGEVVDGKVSVSWTASDPDQDPLDTTLLYSADGGQTWTTVAMDIDGSSLLLDLGKMPGGTNARLRVMVSDGFNTAFDDSDEPFEVVDPAPELLVLTPDGSRFNENEAVILSAVAFDAEDGDLSDSISWTSDVAGSIGSGAQLEAGPLALGPHAITANVYDGRQQLTTSGLTVVIDAPEPALGLALATGALTCAALGRRRARPRGCRSTARC